MKNTLPVLSTFLATLILAPAAFAANVGDFSGSVAIGTGYAGTYAAPTDGLIVQGPVGIGTQFPNPLGMLHILSTSSGGNTPFIYLENTSGASPSTPSTFGPGLILLNDVSGQHGFILEQQQDNNGSFGVADAASPYTQYLVVGQSGKVGIDIGTSVASYLLQVGSSSVSGVVAGFQNSSDLCTLTPAASTPTWSCSSDMRLKRDIADSDDALAWLDGVRVRDFTMKSTGERQTGVIAQELAAAHPDMVHMGANGFYAVDSPNPWLLVKSIQELRAIVTEQQKEIDALKQSAGQGVQQQ